MSKLFKNRIVWFVIFFFALPISFIAYQRFIQMLEKSKEGVTKGTIVNFELGTIKSATSIYYGDSQGIWPHSLTQLIPKYLDSIPKDPMTGSQKVVFKYDGTGGWVYNHRTGEVRPNFFTPTPAK